MPREIPYRWTYFTDNSDCDKCMTDTSDSCSETGLFGQVGAVRSRIRIANKAWLANAFKVEMGMSRGYMFQVMRHEQSL